MNLSIIRKSAKIIGGVVTGFSVKHVVDDAISNNMELKLDSSDTPKWAKILKIGTVYVGTTIISAMVSNAAEKYISTSIDKAFDGLNKTLKTNL